jgi:catechol 2,3-dioxygenase-like lactoylglutathione lyase family enzyme
MTDASTDLAMIEAERERIRDSYLRPTGQRPASTARGLHHTALISSDVERTIRFYQELLGFPLTELIENRDYPGSSHFFFDIGHGNLLAFFDFPGLDVGPYAEVLGGLHHVAISVEPAHWEAIVRRFEEAGRTQDAACGSAHVAESVLIWRVRSGQVPLLRAAWRPCSHGPGPRAAIVTKRAWRPPSAEHPARRSDTILDLSAAPSGLH